MLRELRIKNLAVIENVTVPFDRGLNVLTGETGAGKSILVDAILLVCGARAQGDVIRTDADAAAVEASSTSRAMRRWLPSSTARAWLTRAASWWCGASWPARAVIGPSSTTPRSRWGSWSVSATCWWRSMASTSISGCWSRPVSSISSTALPKPRRCARRSPTFTRYRGPPRSWSGSAAPDAIRAQREDLLRFQLSELDGAHLRPGEEEELRTEHRRLQHAERLSNGLGEAAALLVEDPDAASARYSPGRPDPERPRAPRPGVRRARGAAGRRRGAGGRSAARRPALGRSIDAEPRSPRGHRRSAGRAGTPQAQVRRHRGGHARLPATRSRAGARAAGASRPRLSPPGGAVRPSCASRPWPRARALSDARREAAARLSALVQTRDPRTGNGPGSSSRWRWRRAPTKTSRRAAWTAVSSASRRTPGRSSGRCPASPRGGAVPDHAGHSGRAGGRRPHSHHGVRRGGRGHRRPGGRRGGREASDRRTRAARCSASPICRPSRRAPTITCR